MPGLHLLHACLPLAGSHSFWETAVYFSHPSPPCTLELHGLPGKQCAATGEQNFFLLSFECHGHPAAALLVPPQTHCEELVALHKLQRASRQQRRVVLRDQRCPCLLQAPRGECWHCCFLQFCALLSFLEPLKLPGGVVPSVPSLQRDGFGAFP